MVRRYDEPVEVRRGPVPDWPEEGPTQFLWRGRLWKVRGVLAHWVETGAWWQHGGIRAVIGSEDPSQPPGRHPGEQPETQQGAGTTVEELLGERRLWRVEAGRGPAGGAGPGTFDLCHDPVEDRWQLVGCTD